VGRGCAGDFFFGFTLGQLVGTIDLPAALGVLGTPPGVADDSTAAWKRAEIIVGQRVGAVVRGVFEVPVVVEGGVERVAEFVADAGDGGSKGGLDACD